MGTTSSAADTERTTVVVNDEIRLMVTGGDRLERESLVAALEKQDERFVPVAARHREALRTASEHHAQVAVVLYDEASQLDLCRRLSIRRPPVGVVLADSFRSSHDLALCWEAGARGFVHRDSPVTVLTEAVREVACGRDFEDPRVPTEREDPFGLTERELEVLWSLRPGRTYRDVAERLHIAEDTVKFHLKNIYSKLQVHGRDEALAVAVHEGLVKSRQPRSRA